MYIYIDGEWFENRFSRNDRAMFRFDKRRATSQFTHVYEATNDIGRLVTIFADHLRKDLTVTMRPVERSLVDTQFLFFFSLSF